MSRLVTLEPLSGVKDLTSLLELMSDPKKYKAALSAMEKLRNEINVRVKAVGGLDVIERLHLDAETKANKATVMLKKAQEQVAKEKADSAKSIREASAKSAEKIRAAEETIRDTTTSLNQRSQSVHTKEREAAKLLQEAQAEKKSTAADRAYVDSLIREYKKKMSILEETLGRLA